MDPIKVLAIVIFLLIYILIVSDRIHRTIVALWGALLFAGFPIITSRGVEFGLLTHGDLLRYENWEALGLIFGMFTLVAALRESGFFRWLGLTLVKLADFDILKIFILFALASAILSAFMDSITVLLFLSTLTIEVCGLLKINYLPFLLLEICSANIGGASTMVGDPPNIIIGTSYHYSFLDFVFNTGPIAVVAFMVNLLFFYIVYRNMFLNRDEIALEAKRKNSTIDPYSAISDLKLMSISTFIFSCVIIMLVFHHFLGLSVAFVGIFGASLVLLFGGEKMPDVLERIEWNTLIFFACLFIMVGGLEKVGVLSDIANFITNLAHGNSFLLVMAIIWFSAVFSAFIDNVPFAAAMVPIVRQVSLQTGIPLGLMAWALALGTDIGGNGTPIGASANVVGISVAEKRTGLKVRWSEYCKVAVPATILSVVTCSVLIFLRYML